MTIRYIGTNNTVVTDATITKIEPVKMGTKLLVTNSTTAFIINVGDVVEISA